MSEPEWYTTAKAKGLIVEERGCNSTPLPPIAPKPLQMPPLPAVESKPKPKPKATPLPTSRLRLDITVENLRLRSTANMGGQLKAAIARKTATKDAVREALLRVARFPLPCVVVMTRLGGKDLDSDENLPMAFKSVKDVIADWLGLPNDKDRRVKWRFKQLPAYKCGFRLTFLENS